MIDAEPREAGCRSARPPIAHGEEDDEDRRSSRRGPPSPAACPRPCRRTCSRARRGSAGSRAARGSSRAASGSRTGCAEFTLKKPPPFVPSCLMAICEAAGPSASTCSVSSTSVCGCPLSSRRLAVRSGHRLVVLEQLDDAPCVRPERLDDALRDERPARARATAAAGCRACCGSGRPRSCRSCPPMRRAKPRISATSTAMPVAADTKFCTVRPSICVR